ncbi:hypothetical protein GEMRC1_012446 [Eukaryota sp. GEM-RC1]
MENRKPRTAHEIRQSLSSGEREHFEHRVQSTGETCRTVCEPERRSHLVCEPRRETERGTVCREIDVGNWSEESPTGPTVQSEELVMQPVARESVKRQPLERVVRRTEGVTEEEAQQRKEFSSK